jgi:phosphopantothenoylcysteine decarboxylase/phosphopantothenate--cysteine ligase
LKKGSSAPILRLVANPDILAALSKERRGPFPRLAGFALETNALVANAQKKLVKKKLDVVVANSPAALGAARSRAVLIQPGQAPRSFAGDKKILADLILTRLLEAVQAHE